MKNFLRLIRKNAAFERKVLGMSTKRESRTKQGNVYVFLLGNYLRELR